MARCERCDELYHDDFYCIACEQRRTELLRRLEVDGSVVTMAVVSGWVVLGMEDEPMRRWRIG